MHIILKNVKINSFVLLFVLLIMAIIFPNIGANAQSADGAERAAASCVARGGEWDGSQGRCSLEGPCQISDSLLGIPTWYKYLDKELDSTGKCNVVLGGDDTEGKANSILPIGIAVLEAMLRISGLVAVVMVFWGGFKYITAQGNPDNAKGARTTIINAMIGLVIVILSTAIVSFIGRSI